MPSAPVSFTRGRLRPVGRAGTGCIQGGAKSHLINVVLPSGDTGYHPEEYRVKFSTVQRTILSPEQYSTGETAEGIAICLKILQAAADFIFASPQIRSGSYAIPSQDGHLTHRVIVATHQTLLLERPYIVGFYGIRSLDPDGNLTKDLTRTDDRLIESLGEYRVGLYNTARMGGEYANTAVLPSMEASKTWALENSLHQAAASHLAPKCYSQVLKFTGYVDGWPADCRFDLDEVIWMK